MATIARTYIKIKLLLLLLMTTKQVLGLSDKKTCKRYHGEPLEENYNCPVGEGRKMFGGIACCVPCDTPCQHAAEARIPKANDGKSSLIGDGCHGICQRCFDIKKPAQHFKDKENNRCSQCKPCNIIPGLYTIKNCTATENSVCGKISERMSKLETTTGKPIAVTGITVIDPQHSKGSDKPNTGPNVMVTHGVPGILVAVVFVLVVIGFLYCLYNKRRKDKQKQKNMRKRNDVEMDLKDLPSNVKKSKYAKADEEMHGIVEKPIIRVEATHHSCCEKERLLGSRPFHIRDNEDPPRSATVDSVHVVEADIAGEDVREVNRQNENTEYNIIAGTHCANIQVQNTDQNVNDETGTTDEPERVSLHNNSVAEHNECGQRATEEMMNTQYVDTENNCVHGCCTEHHLKSGCARLEDQREQIVTGPATYPQEATIDNSRQPNKTSKKDRKRNSSYSHSVHPRKAFLRERSLSAPTTFKCGIKKLLNLKMFEEFWCRKH